MTTITHNEAIQRLANEFFATQNGSATTKEIAAWLIATEQWFPPRDVLMRQCQEEVARALREDYISDSRGRPVRAKHVARITEGGTQKHLWSDIRDPNVPREKFEASFQQRREQIVGDCRQLKYDVDYFNDLRSDDAPIQLMFDFRDDIEEAAFPTQYPPKYPR